MMSVSPACLDRGFGPERSTQVSHAACCWLAPATAHLPGCLAVLSPAGWWVAGVEDELSLGGGWQGPWSGQGQDLGINNPCPAGTPWQCPPSSPSPAANARRAPTSLGSLAIVSGPKRRNLLSGTQESCPVCRQDLRIPIGLASRDGGCEVGGEQTGLLGKGSFLHSFS